MKLLVNLIVISPLFINLIDGFVVGQKLSQAHQGQPQCGKENQHILWPDFSDNSGYYECSGINIIHKRKCPPSLLFSFNKQVCVWEWEWHSFPSEAELASVSTTLTPTTIQPESSTEIEDSCKICWRPKCEEMTDQDQLWPDFDDKKFYFECQSKGVLKRRPCGPHTVFVFEKQMCLWESEWIEPPLELLEAGEVDDDSNGIP